MKTKIALILAIILVYSNVILAQIEPKKGKNPLIIIPGIMGSKLVNKNTNETVWVRFKDAKDDDLNLPISPDLGANKDDLVATDIVENIKFVKFLPGISVYEDLLNYLEKKGGYQRGNWEIPSESGDTDTYYVFPYDWRRDNVETAHLLIQKIEKLKAKLKRPDLKFDVLAHSMGGLITRYAAMYGMSDLRERPNPTWAGAKHFGNIFMLGTPNEGSMEALDALNNGSSISIPLGGRYYPSFFSREVGFTMPALFQLLPHGEAARFYDGNLNLIDIDIYDSKNWKRYGWTLTADEEYMAKLSKAKRVQAEKYLDAVLLRAKRFHEALDVKAKVPESLSFYLFGSDCKTTLDGAVVFFDIENGGWKTLTRGEGFKNVRGEKISDKLVKQTIYAKGDGTVTLKSLLAETISEKNGQNLFAIKPYSSQQMIVCEMHSAIPGNKIIQESFSSILMNKINRNFIGN
ncbi:MAG TPA: hypothetical protein PKY82_13310 [Pyrinomonadaceae bacterium]|nr:hypothetical protein [Pyrinomonadaceae bacterium]